MGNNIEALYVQVLDEDVFLNEGKMVLLLKCNVITWWEFRLRSFRGSGPSH